MLDLVCPVVGVPFISQTRVTKTITMVHRSASKVIIDIESKTYEAPYSDTFVCKEAWVVIGSEQDPNYEHLILT